MMVVDQCNNPLNPKVPSHNIREDLRFNFLLLQTNKVFKQFIFLTQECGVIVGLLTVYLDVGLLEVTVVNFHCLNSVLIIIIMYCHNTCTSYYFLGSLVDGHAQLPVLLDSQAEAVEMVS